jgi:flagellar M-ring protein FliF
MAKNVQSVAALWQKAGLAQRITLLTLLLSCIGGAALLVNWARKPRLVLLYSGLAPEDAVKIVDKIRDADIPYELKGGGTAIYVPEEKVYSLRLTAASQGLPTGQQAGYKILDDEDIGTSPFAQRINYRRALEGELARTIQMLEGVVSVRVHVARPEPSLFVGSEKESSATVALRLRAGHRLSPANVAAIVHLVAGSVEGLRADNVVVVDTAGNLLSGQTDTELAKGTNSFLDYKTRVESYLARKAEDMLAAVLGPDRASVRVDAIIETSSLSESTTTYTPDGRVATKEEEEIKSTTPPAAAGGESARPAAATKESTMSTEYLVSSKIEERRDLPGKIKSLSVAALVDLSPAEEKTEGGAPPQPAITEKDVKAIICKATGVTETDIEVVNAPFRRPAAPAAEGAQAGPGNWDFYLALAKRFSLGILVIGALLVLKMFGRSKKESAALALEGESGRAGLLGAREVETSPDLLRARITDALAKNPEEVRRLFLTWVQSEEGEA